MPEVVYILTYDDVQVNGDDSIHKVYFSKINAEAEALHWNTLPDRMPWDKVIIVEHEVSDA